LLKDLCVGVVGRISYQSPEEMTDAFEGMEVEVSVTT